MHAEARQCTNSTAMNIFTLECNWYCGCAYYTTEAEGCKLKTLHGYWSSSGIFIIRLFKTIGKMCPHRKFAQMVHPLSC